MMNKFQKILSAAFFSLLIINPLAGTLSKAHAQAGMSPDDFLYIYGKLGKFVNKSIGIASDTALNAASFAGGHILESIIIGLNSLIAGENWNKGQTAYATPEKILANLKSEEGYDPESNGVLGLLGSGTYTLASKPPDVQTGDFFYSTLANNILGIKTAHAAGTDTFNTVLEVWKAFRNLAYYLIIVVLIIAGFMLMFRYQLGPRVEITLFAVLPKIIVALILITFSYAIGGFLLDLGIVTKAIIEEFLKSLPGMDSVSFTFPMEYGIFRVIFASYIFDIAGTFRNALDGGLLNPIKDLGLLLGGADLSGTGVISAVLMLVIRVVTVVIAFYLFFMLLLRFASLFIYLIISPMAFLWGAVPGQQDATTKWFKMFMVNVLTFPLVYLLFNLALYIRFFPEQIQMPAIGMGTVDSATGLVEGTYINPIVAFGILLLTTKVPAFLEDALDVVPSGHVAKAGVDIGKSAKKIPLIGGFLG